MLHEFALDPEVLSNWKDFKYFVEKFGVHQGRMISRFPKKWAAMVIAACSNCGEVERKRIEEGLVNLRGRLLKNSRDYNRELRWLENAEAQHRTQPFHAIISTSNPRNSAEVMIADEVDELRGNTPLWTVPREDRVRRRAEDMVQCVSLLFRISSRVILVDRNFNPYQPRFTASLARFIEAIIAANPAITRIEYHLCVDPERGSTKEYFEEGCTRYLTRLVPPGVELILTRWKERSPGKAFHARYVLTEVGGVRYEYGLDEGEEGQFTDVSLLDPIVHREAWEDIQRAAAASDASETVPSAFDVDCEVIIRGSANIRLRR